MRTALAIVFVFILVLGCLRSIGSVQYSQNYIDNMTRVAINDPSELQNCSLGKCWCMVCRNGTNIFGNAINSLVGGSCYWNRDCNETTAHHLMSTGETPDLAIRGFMLGQGPTIADFADAHPYCSYRLTMAVQWLQGNAEAPYTYPDAARSICLLSKNIIPVYVLYSGGENINLTRSNEIGNRMRTEGKDFFNAQWTEGPVGPVIIVTEIDFNYSQREEIVQQIDAVHTGCQNNLDPEENRSCWVAVAPKIGDFESLDWVMQSAGSKVDIIAFGVNGKYVDACENDRINVAKMMNQVRNFTSHALYVYQKPVLIPYVLFDRGSRDINNCTWTDRDVVSGYSAFFPTGVLDLQQRGLIGIAPYSFNASRYGTVSNPLRCSDCSLGTDELRLRAWYGWCQSYANISRKGALPHAGAGTPIVFPNESGGYCDFNAQQDFALREVMYGDARSTRDFMNPNLPEMRSPLNKTFSCSACLTYNMSLRADTYFGFTHTTNVPSNRSCSSYPEIEHWADIRNLDPMLVRAFILTESNFTQCAAAKVCREDYDGAGCFEPGPTVDECYYKAYDEIWDPGGTCDVNLTNAPNSNSDEPDWRWCAFGLMQSVEPPYTFWPEDLSDQPIGEPRPYSHIFERSGFNQDGLITTVEDNVACAQETDPRGMYNPFNPSHSLCIGTLKMERGLREAHRQVEEMHDANLLNWDEGNTEQNAIFEAYILGHMYAGFWDMPGGAMRYAGGFPPPCAEGVTVGQCFIQEFHDAWTHGDTWCAREASKETPHHRYDEICDGTEARKEKPNKCFGYTDPIRFYGDCIMPFLPRKADPGKTKMNAYFALQNCPTNMCPDGKRLVQAMCEPDATGEIDQEMCDAPGVPHIPGSGTYYLPDAAAEQEDETDS